MEIGDGVYISSVTTEEWLPDPDVGGEMHTLIKDDRVEAGLSRFEHAPLEPIHWTLPERETLLVLEGEATIEILGGPTLNLKPGDMASMPKGAETIWHLVTPFREFWVLA